jgi:D-alanyl-D-alanine carboxypeptidase/D-alanyl-D-alanine-endopeptidase (penicillin-binding protein 4)
LRAAGPIDNGVLAGDLVVVGSGDPSLTAADGMADRVFADWAARLKAAGIRRVAGRIVGDGTALGAIPYGDGWMWDDLVDEYSAGVTALQLNEDAVRVEVAPGPSAGASAGITVTPVSGGITIDNNVITSAAGTDPSVIMRRLPGVSRLDVGGTIPLGHAPIAAGVSVADPTQFFVDALRAALVRDGIDVQQSAIRNPQSAAREGRTLVEYRSPPLSTLALRLMKISQNQYAETLFRTVGGRDGVLQVLQPWGVAPADLIQRDGSGLSRYDLVTPQAFVTILTHIARSPKLKEPFEASLPIAGDLGLTTRMKGTPAEGNAHAKTGSMTAVRALSGYVMAADGEPLVFSILANNFDAEPATINRATDAIVVRLARFTR